MAGPEDGFELSRMLRTSAEMPLVPLDRQTRLGELAYTSLKAAIVRGEFAPGQKLTLRAVAHALGVSTTPARDAITRLIGEGALVNIGPKTIVLPPLTHAVLEEVTAIRLSLEGMAAVLATARIGAEEIDQLKRIQNHINAALDEQKYANALKYNREFHFLIYGSTAMPRLVAMIESLWLRIGPALNDLYPAFATSRVGVSNHLAAIAGLEGRDPLRVRAAIEKDIRDGYERLAQRIQG
jgi:DNA-binding GntR family transcriptional regulator